MAGKNISEMTYLCGVGRKTLPQSINQPTQFWLPPTRLSTNGISHTCSAFTSFILLIHAILRFSFSRVWLLCCSVSRITLLYTLIVQKVRH